MKITKSRFEEIIKEELEKHLDEIGRKLPSQIPTNRPEPEHGYDKAGFPRDQPKGADEELREALDAMYDLKTNMEKHTTHWQDEINVKTVEEWVQWLSKSINIVSKLSDPDHGHNLTK